MCKKFLAKGYPRENLIEFKQWTLDTPRNELLIPKIRGEVNKRIPCGKGHTNVEEFKLPPLFSFRRDRNLKDQLVKSILESWKRFINVIPVPVVTLFVICCPCGLFYVGETTMETAA
ncbi:unnamed protein product [Ranitomeya imitator]|uniref:Uncharacterized protein n=1 Tax=Ranitomeya imitator TaxID=111125 RepID=A0ABN9MV42_9NEOB|nr:unnamed protein product [Ranitomeya imitator]